MPSTHIFLPAPTLFPAPACSLRRSLPQPSLPTLPGLLPSALPALPAFSSTFSSAFPTLSALFVSMPAHPALSYGVYSSALPAALPTLPAPLSVLFSALSALLLHALPAFSAFFPTALMQHHSPAAHTALLSALPSTLLPRSQFVFSAPCSHALSSQLYPRAAHIALHALFPF